MSSVSRVEGSLDVFGPLLSEVEGRNGNVFSYQKYGAPNVIFQ